MSRPYTNFCGTLFCTSYDKPTNRATDRSQNTTVFGWGLLHWRHLGWFSRSLNIRVSCWNSPGCELCGGAVVSRSHSNKPDWTGLDRGARFTLPFHTLILSLHVTHIGQTQKHKAGVIYHIKVVSLLWHNTFVYLMSCTWLSLSPGKCLIPAKQTLLTE